MSEELSLVVIASTMRSGSTLLKALIAEANDVLNLPETNFQNPRVVQRVIREHQSGDPPLKTLKKPAWYQESKRYPKLPKSSRVKTIALVRDVYDTVVSLRKMTFRAAAPLFAPLVTDWLARTYWWNVTSNLVQLSIDRPDDVLLVRYEDILHDPIGKTQGMYRFIGSTRTAGTRTYSPPENFRWRWGTDDGSDNIKSLEVQRPREKNRDEKRLNRVIENCPRIQQLRKQLNYI